MMPLRQYLETGRTMHHPEMPMRKFYYDMRRHQRFILSCTGMGGTDNIQLAYPLRIGAQDDLAEREHLMLTTCTRSGPHPIVRWLLRKHKSETQNSFKFRPHLPGSCEVQFWSGVNL